MGEVLSIPQQWYMHQQEVAYARKNLTLDRKSLTIDHVNLIREDMRDLWEQRCDQINNLMIVNTLLFGVSCDLSYQSQFAITYNDTPENVEQNQVADRYLVSGYGMLLAVTVLAPFWAIYFAVNVKQNLSRYLTRVFLHSTQNDMSDRTNVKVWKNHYINFEKYWNKHCQSSYILSGIAFWTGMTSLLLSLSYLLGMTYYTQYEAKRSDAPGMGAGGWKTPIPLVVIIWGNFLVVLGRHLFINCCRRNVVGERAISLWCRKRCWRCCWRCCIDEYALSKKYQAIADDDEDENFSKNRGFDSMDYTTLTRMTSERSPPTDVSRQLNIEDIFGIEKGPAPKEDDEKDENMENGIDGIADETAGKTPPGMGSTVGLLKRMTSTVGRGIQGAASTLVSGLVPTRSHTALPSSSTPRRKPETP